MIRLDPLELDQPVGPVAGHGGRPDRATERGTVLFPEEALTREQAIRLYTINNAYLHHEEKEKGSLEVGKLGDLIVIDRDVLTCPVEGRREHAGAADGRRRQGGVREAGLKGPVLADEAGHAAEVAEVSGDDGAAGLERDGGDAEVVPADVQLEFQELVKPLDGSPGM